MAAATTYARNYLRNVGRSTLYATKDVLKDNTPYLNSLFKESKETVTDLYRTVKDFSSGKMKEVTSLGKDALDNVFKNLKDDLKSGDFYNKGRDDILDEQMMKMIGFDLEDMDFSFDEDSFDFGSDSDDITTGDEIIIKQNAKNTAATIMAVDKVGAKVASGVNQGTAASANYIVKSNRAMNKALYDLNVKGFASITEALAALNKNTISMNEAIAQPLTTFMQNGTVFFAKTTEQLDKIEKLLEKSIELRGGYNKPSSSARRDRSLNAILNDGFSVSAYKELVTGNIKEYTDIFTGILGMFSGNKNMKISDLAKGFSPLRPIMKMAVSSMISSELTGALKAFDNTLKDFIPSMIAKAMSSKGSGGIISSFLRGIFLPKNELQREVGKNYTKGPVPFDGETKRAITYVIPKYLSHIVSALNGSLPVEYNYASGEFIRSKDIGALKDKREREYAARGGGKLREDALKSARSNRSRNEIEEFFLQAMLSGEGFTDINTPNFKNTKLGRQLSPDTLKLLQDLVKTKKYTGTPASIMRSRSDLNKLVKELSASGSSIETALYDNSLALGGGSLFEDKYHNTQLDYLRGIYLNTLYGTGRRSSKGPVGGIKSSGIDADRPKFGAGNSLATRGTSKGTPSRKSMVDPHNPDQVDAWNAKIDKELEKLCKEQGRLEAKLKSNPNNNDIAAQLDKIQAKINKVSNEWVAESNPEFRLNAIRMGSGVSTYLEEKADSTKSFIQDKLKKVLPDNALQFFSRPIDAFTTLLNKLTDSMNDFLWGDGTDRGIFQKIKDKVSDFIKEHETLSKFLGPGFGGEMKQAFSDYWGWMTGKSKKSKDVQGAAGGEFTEGPIPTAANGRRITRSGLIAVSEGELVIPAERNPFYRKSINKRDQYRREANAVRSYWGSYADGGTAKETWKDIFSDAIVDAGRKITRTVAGDKGSESNKRFTEMFDSFGDDFKVARGRVGAGFIIGAGLGGALGSPVLGSIIGSTIGFVSKSEKAQKFLFGDYDEEKGEYSGGMFSPKVSKFLNENAPDMLKGGSIGLLLGGGLFGPVGMTGGLVLGSALGYAKKSKAFEKFLFGETDEEGNIVKKGLLDKKKFKSALPNAIIGSGLGLLLGPIGGSGGLLLNMMLGAGLGFLTANEKVHKFLFGEEKDGKKTDGLLNKIGHRLFGGIEDLFANTANWIKVGITNLGKNIITKIGNVKEWITKSLERRRALKSNVRKTPLRKAAEGLGKTLGITAGSLLAAPFLLPFLPAIAGGAGLVLGPRALANARMRKNARRGYNIYSSKEHRNLTAAERVAFRDKYKGTRGLGGEDNRWNQFDQSLAGMSKGDLESTLDILNDTDESNRELNQLKYKEEAGFYSSLGGENQNLINSAQMSKIANYIRSGDVESLQSYIINKGIPSSIGDKALESAQRVADKKNKIKSDKRGLMEMYGIKNAKDITKAQDLIRNEIAQMTPEQQTAANSERAASASERAANFIEKLYIEGFKIRSKKTKKYDATNNNTSSDENEVDNIDETTSSEEPEVVDGKPKKTSFWSLNADGNPIKKVWDSTKKFFKLDTRDKGTKEALESEDEQENATIESKSILSKIASGFSSFRNKLFGDPKSKNKSSIFDKLKDFGATLLKGLGVVGGVLLLPKFFNWMNDTAIPWFKESWPKIKSFFTEVWEGLKSAWETLSPAITTIIDILKFMNPNYGTERTSTGTTNREVIENELKGFEEENKNQGFWSKGQMLDALDLSRGSKGKIETDKLNTVITDKDTMVSVGYRNDMDEQAQTVYKVNWGGPTDYVSTSTYGYTFVSPNENAKGINAKYWTPVLCIKSDYLDRFLSLYSSNANFKRELSYYMSNDSKGKFSLLAMSININGKKSPTILELIREYEKDPNKVFDSPYSGIANKSGGRGLYIDNATTFKGVIKSIGYSITGHGSGLYGKGSGFVSQLDPRYANKKFGSSTVGLSGCAPAVASMVADAYGRNLTMNDAINLGNFYTTYDGTDSNYFKAVLGQRGITVDQLDAEGIARHLSVNSPTILLGSDPTNSSKSTSPFGPQNHYVLATGMDQSGRIIVNDPEATAPKRYDPKILESATLGLSTGIYGRGTSLLDRVAKNSIGTVKSDKSTQKAPSLVDRAAQNTIGNIKDSKKTVRNVQFDPAKSMYLVEYTDNTSEWMKNPPSATNNNFSKNTVENVKKYEVTQTTPSKIQRGAPAEKVIRYVQFDPAKSMYLVEYTDNTSEWMKEPPSKDKKYTNNMLEGAKLPANAPALQAKKKAEDTTTSTGISMSNIPSASAAPDYSSGYNATATDTPVKKVSGLSKLQKLMSIFSTGMNSIFTGTNTRQELANLKASWEESGSGSRLYSNAYSNLISSSNRYYGTGSGIVKNNNIIVRGKGSDGTLEQLVSAIIQILTTMVDIDSADSKNIAAIKANSDQIGAIKELVAKYGDYKTTKNNQPADDVDNGSKAVVNQLGTMSARA